ncbi:MAG TPA: bifunctional nuclease domain-containing protein [Streptosporangiaceae bacterium]|jgi:bifunctional DNase/RNase
MTLSRPTSLCRNARASGGCRSGSVFPRPRPSPWPWSRSSSRALSPIKLTASLLQAAGSGLTEVRITRLTNSVFYAAVIVQGPDGPREVDSRPSDAVNLALAAGAPIRVDSHLFSGTLSGNLAEKLESSPVATAEIAAEVQQSMQALRAELGHDPSPEPGEATPHRPS